MPLPGTRSCRWAGEPVESHARLPAAHATSATLGGVAASVGVQGRLDRDARVDALSGVRTVVPRPAIQQVVAVAARQVVVSSTAVLSHRARRYGENRESVRLLGPDESP